MAKMLIMTFSSTSPGLILKRPDTTHKSEDQGRKQIWQKLRLGASPSRLGEAYHGPMNLCLEFGRPSKFCQICFTGQM